MAKKIDLDGLDFFKGKENAMVASEYSSSSTYALGDYVYHAGTLYKCTTAITTAEAWTSGHWTAAKLANDVSEQSDRIDNIESDNYFETTKSKMAGNYATVNDATAFTKNWANVGSTTLMQGIPITNAVKLESVKYNVGSTSAYQQHYIGLCTISGSTATITHVFRKAGTTSGIISADVNFELDSTKEYYLFITALSGRLCWIGDSAGSKYYTFSNPNPPTVGGTVSITTNSGTSVDIAEMAIIYETELPFLTAEPKKQGTVIVAKSGGDYTTLTAALSAIEDSSNNPVTILLYPGTYEEHVTILNRYVSIVGVNRETCIIRDNSGKYNNEPIKISGGKWLLENLTLYSTHSAAGGWTPTWVFPDMASYALHIDNGSSGGYGVVRNCHLYCENSNAIGAGTHNGETIRIENCIIERNTTDNDYINSDYDGAVACHSPNIYDDSETASEFNMYNCDVICNLDKALQLRHLASTAKMKCVMVGNTLVANGAVSDVVVYKGSHTSKSDYLKAQSHGNSTAELNYST